MFCNTTPGVPHSALAAGADVNTRLFAEGVHTSLGGHKVISNFMAQQLKTAGWI